MEYLEYFILEIFFKIRVSSRDTQTMHEKLFLSAGPAKSDFSTDGKKHWFKHQNHVFSTARAFARQCALKALDITQSR